MFLYNGEQSYSYADLLKAVCMDDYVPLLKTHDLFKYFSNLIKALVNNKPLVLLDSDLSLSELGGINEEKINVIEKLRTQKFSSMDEVVKALQQSASEITIFTSGTTGQPKKVIHSVQGLTRSVRCAERYQWQVWAYAYNPTHMAGLQVFFQAFENQNTLVNVFGLARNEVYSLIEKYSVTHISATPTFYRYNPQIQISAESETKRSIFREKDKTKRSKKESAQHSKSRNKSFVMTSVSAL